MHVNQTSCSSSNIQKQTNCDSHLFVKSKHGLSLARVGKSSLLKRLHPHGSVATAVLSCNLKTTPASAKTTTRFDVLMPIQDVAEFCFTSILQVDGFFLLADTFPMFSFCFLSMLPDFSTDSIDF